MRRLKDLGRSFMITAPPQFQSEFVSDTNNIVLERYHAAAKSLIVLELVMIFVVAAFKRKDLGETLFHNYIFMYMIMIVGMAAYILCFRRFKKNGMKKESAKAVLILATTLFVIIWCGVIAIMDQLVYGQMIVYIVAVLAIAEFSYIKPLMMLMVFFFCQLVLFIALSFVDLESGVVFVCIVNTSIFVLLSWIISVMLYKQRIADFINKKTIEENSEMLNRMNRKLHEVNEELEKLSVTDSLTGLYNRRKFVEILELEWQRGRRYKEQVALIFIDIDLFKSYNDFYGHLAGDDCIHRIADVLKHSVRRSVDFIARYGGEEFVVVLPQTGKRDALEIAETIRRNVEALALPHKASKVSQYVTISLGVHAVVPDEHMTIEEFIKGADTALYLAKERNRNQTAVYGE